MLLGLPEFEMFVPRTVEDACSLLCKYGEDAQLVAGGTDLFVKMKQRRLVPRILINIKKIPGLDEIRYDTDKGLAIGALTSVQAIHDSDVINKKFRVLSQAAGDLAADEVALQVPAREAARPRRDRARRGRRPGGREDAAGAARRSGGEAPDGAAACRPRARASTPSPWDGEYTARISDVSAIFTSTCKSPTGSSAG